MSRAGRKARITAVAVLALLAAGLPTAAHAADAESITGTITLPQGIEVDEMYADTYRWDAEDEEWDLYKYQRVYESGPFEIDDLTPGEEYRLALWIDADGYLGGFYAAAGLSLVGDPAVGLPVYAGQSGFVLAPVKGVPFTSQLSAFDGFDWSAGSLTVSALELSHDLSREVATSESIVTSAGTFTVPNIRPGSRYAIYVEDRRGRAASGFHHAGVDGLVADFEHATPVAYDANLHIKLGASSATPRLSVVDAPRITGTAVVGEKLTASTGEWSLTKAAFSYEWLRGGTVIAGARSSTYTPTPADAGSKLTVRVTATRAGFTKAVAASSPTAAVAKKAAPRATKAPTVKGTYRLGKKLRATASGWSVPGVTTSYQWLRNGKAITGATKRTYTLKKKDVGKRVSVRVTGSKAGHDDGASSSKAKKVAKGKPKVTAKVKNVHVGARAKVVVRVKAAGVKKPTGTVRVKYGKAAIKATLRAKSNGKVSVRLPQLGKGSYRVKVTFTPTKASAKLLTKASAKRVTLRVR